jgi:hypothetical protein
MKRKTLTLYVATTIDDHGVRHIGQPPLCGATGTPYAPSDHQADALCLRCRELRAAEMARAAMERFFAE